MKPTTNPSITKKPSEENLTLGKDDNALIYNEATGFSLRIAPNGEVNTVVNGTLFMMALYHRLMHDEPFRQEMVDYAYTTEGFGEMFGLTLVTAGESDVAVQ